MIKLLKQRKTYFASEKKDTEKIINNNSERAEGVLVNEQVKRKYHKDHGVYYEVIVDFEITDSKAILDAGMFQEGDEIESDQKDEKEDE